jgi:hypothetical protein
MTKDEIIADLVKTLQCTRVTMLKAHYCISLFVGGCPEIRETEWAVHGIDDCLNRTGARNFGFRPELCPQDPTSPKTESNG